ncbi:hypothetical protein N657DRAFT_354295 [Parathielavia appendiculata]|uniref:GAT domain-containing protein n=1 Tax=Parathielavia appendiculata TaxID=2587402 RepID=A0AAN6U2C8_9PEZI|nr:hypothetical protein N657DRAFT_354295 [Parathielavia appendiculata]
MAGFSMTKVLGTMKKRPAFGGATGSAEATPADAPVDTANGTPEIIASRCVKQFCQSVGNSTGDDVIFLPPIVEAAVASPAASAECARQIRKFMSRDFWSKPSCQYNAIMLARILADNPGPGFTKFLDKKFVDTTKELLRSGRDGSVRQILMETLDAFENTKSQDEGLAMVIEMWKKEKEKAYRAYGGIPVAQVPGMVAPPFNPYQHPPPGASHPRQDHSKRLPDPVELANRLEEARTSAKLLEQVVACTLPSEVLSNDLFKEFADRCSSASRSIQGYMSAENPAPDNDTMESLIDTNEQLQQALNHHHRALLQAKKQLGQGDARSSTSNPAPQSRSHHQQPPAPVGQQQRAAPPAPPAPLRKPVAGSSNSKGKANPNTYDTSAVAGPSRSASGTPVRHGMDDTDDEGQDPFRDPPTEQQHQHHYQSPSGSSSRPADDPPRLSFEPFHPGFGGAASSTAAVGPAATDKGRAEPVTPVSDDEQDAYEATPRKEGHVYRY